MTIETTSPTIARPTTFYLMRLARLDALATLSNLTPFEISLIRHATYSVRRALSAHNATFGGTYDVKSR